MDSRLLKKMNKKELENRGSLFISFLFKNMMDKGKFSDYKWPITFSVGKKISARCVR